MPEETTTETQDTGTDTQEEKQFTQADMDRVVENRLKRERDKQGQTAAELEQKLSTYEAAEAERERQARSELDNVKADLEKAQSETQSAKAEMDKLRKQMFRLDWIATNAPPKLPMAYRLLITGDDQDALTVSRDEAVKQYTEDFEAQTGQKPSIGASSPGDDGQPPGKESPDQTLDPYQKALAAS